MEEINKAYATFRERDRIASLGGGVDKIEKQHESGKTPAQIAVTGFVENQRSH